MRLFFASFLYRISGNHKRIAMVASGGLICSFLAAGLFVFPRPLMTPLENYVLPSRAVAPTAGTEMPVFMLVANSMPRKCGRATVAGDVLQVGLWPSAPDGLTLAAEPLLLRADLQTLWALADPEGRAALRKTSDELVTTLRESLRAGGTSVQAESWPMLRALIRRAIHKAWSAPDTQRAFAEAMRTADLSATHGMAADISGVLVEKIEGRVWDNLKAVTTGLFSSDVAPPPPPGGVVAEVFRDERVQQQMADTVANLLQGPEFEVVEARFAANFTNAVLTEDQLVPVILKIVGDTPLIANEAGLGYRLFELLRALPRHLAHLHKDTDHNTLATYVIQNLLQARKAWVVVYLTPEQRRTLGLVGTDKENLRRAQT